MEAFPARKTVALAALALAAVAAVLLAALVPGASPGPAGASSHSEAPLIGEDPRADNTDVYAFVSPDRPDTVTIIANYIPLEAPASGPNFYSFDDTVLYAINIDNDGDSKEDLSYQFRFTTQTRNGGTFLYDDGPITSVDDPNWNRPQTYSITRVGGSTGGDDDDDDDGNGTVLGSGLPTPPVNVGPRSTPDYAGLAAQAVSTLPGGIKLFAGQRDDPFFVDLGSVFDLLGLRPFNPAHIIPLAAEQGVDAVARYNTHAIAMQVPISQLTTPGHPTIGIYASASRQKVRVLRKDGTRSHRDGWVQVSRLGEPLINEVVIPLAKKDLWNREDPKNDEQFLGFYRSPEVARLENALYPVLDDIRETGRDDLVQILLTGVPSLNFTGPRKADLLRLNTSIKPSAAVGAGNRLGVLAGDLAGFPNGRRLEDDVVDIEVRAIAEGYGAFLNGLLGLPNKTPNNTLGDGVDANDKSLLREFPYAAAPHQGYEVP
ncbi:MAG TPA: DUF4331 domain-containing protein [Solirubrobacteraceae bacterium]|nr:DUF4331 domain-containing protein [Solirubrobacteraceae bacterium]